MAAKNGMALGLALQVQEAIESRLNALLYEVRELKQFVTSDRKHFQRDGGGQIEQTALPTEVAVLLPQGAVFVAKRLVVVAPPKTKLQIFKNSVTPNNLLEVCANVQEYADGILGNLTVEGAARLIFVFSGSEAVGPFTFVLSGELIEKESSIHAAA